jgi:chromosome segregation ATPase
MTNKKKELTKSEKMSIAQKKRRKRVKEQEEEGKRNAKELFGVDNEESDVPERWAHLKKMREEMQNEVLSPDLETQLALKNKQIAELELELEKLKTQLAQKNRQIIELELEIEKLKGQLNKRLADYEKLTGKLSHVRQLANAINSISVSLQNI